MTATTVAQLIASARQRIENLSVDQVQQRRAEGEVLLVDLREPAERETNGTIPGAVHAPRGMLEFYSDPTSPYHRPEFQPDAPVVLYCASGGRSAPAADTLRDLGYSQAAHLDGGFNAWSAAGAPVDRT